MPEPLDLAALRAKWFEDNNLSSGVDLLGLLSDLSRCLAVIEALAAALEASLAVEQVDEEGFITAAWNRAYGDARTALALVTGGRHA